MTLRRPSKADLQRISDSRHLCLTEVELDQFHELVCENLGLYDTLDQYPDPPRDVLPAVRIAGERPARADDPLNAVVRACSVRLPGADGRLAGRTIGLKDTICVAGIPMSCASRLLYDFTPVHDATIVRRLLGAGAHITAILNTDDFAFSGGGHTSAYGPTLNAANPAHLAGGSSCGSAAAVATSLVDFAIGGDQGGSIRIPSSWSGIVGHKPTHGLVPYTGIVGFDLTIDHIGPMTRTVADAALLLSVIAGADDDAADPRQTRAAEPRDYTQALTGDIRGLRIAVIEEGFGSAHGQPDVDDAVKAAVSALAKLGAHVETVSVPEHLSAIPVWNAVAIEGGVASFYSGHHSYQNKGVYDPRLMSAMGRGIRTHGGDFSPTAKLGVLVAAYMTDYYDGVFYARARNLARQLNAAYERVFAQYDLVAMPTTPQTAHPLLADQETDRRTFVREALNMCANTSAFDLTGHPSISVPCRRRGGLPVGLMLTGRHFDDATVLRAAHAYEQGAA
ncbi:amidase [Paraburkholderia caballeronis]|uniref:amidase n=1 Tax=Paraburkholderia caballeronis TaxID=416943 RepID=UPI00141708DE|nr:amidase [Paraburkholderia caballeronis]